MNRSHTPRRRNFPARLAAAVATATLVVVPSLRAEPPAAATGTIKGRLVYAIPGPPPKVKVLVEQGDPKVKDEVCKTKTITDQDLVVDPATMGVGNAFAYLVKPTGDYTAVEKEYLAKMPAVVVDQVGCEYVPHSTVVHTDQKLTFKSSDPVGHNVDFKPFANPQINPMLAPNGSVDYKIKGEEKRPTEAKCSIHPWMKGYVFIVDNPYAVVTQPDGSFEIKDVPAGDQQLIVWLGGKGYITTGGNKGMKVTVKGGETTTVPDVKITK